MEKEMRYLKGLFVALGITASGASSSYDLVPVDAYLEKWDRFAQGENELVPVLNRDKASFESELSAALLAQDKKAPARVVFYVVVQIGGSLEVQSKLGKSLAPYLGAGFPQTSKEGSAPVYYAGDIWSWWQRHKESYTAFPLLDEWLQRDFTKQVILPLYQSTASEPSL